MTEFEKKDRFKVNLIDCAMLGAYVLNMPERPTVEALTEYYERAMMKALGLYDLTPAMCHLDYAMSEAGGASNFVREYTIASGGPYCDCGYKKK